MIVYKPRLGYSRLASGQLKGSNSPHIQLLPKEKVVVEVSDGPVHCIAVSHFYHGCPRFALHELHLHKVPKQDRLVQQHIATFTCVCVRGPYICSNSES